MEQLKIMLSGIPIFPDRASTIAKGVDHLHYFLTGITLFFTAIIFATIFYFAVNIAAGRTTNALPSSKAQFPWNSRGL